MAAQEQDLTAKIAMSLDEIIGLNQPSGGEGSPSHVGGDGDREGGRPFRRGRRFPRGSDKPYPRANSPSSSASVTNRVYVGNLSWQTSWQDLKDHMRSAGGTVIHADVFLDEYGRSKGCGIVEYATREEALHAIQTLNDTKIGDSERLIFVREDRETNYFPQRERGAPRGRRGPGPSPSAGGDVAGRQVFVRNLPFSTSWQDLKDYFKQFGRVVRAEALTNTDGTPKGQGTVLFETREDAQNAIARANNTELQGRIIGVQEDRYVA